jgi:electron transfer flavoprotein alpha subunit
MNIQDFSGVFVFAEQVDGQIARVTFELLGKARALAADLGTEVTAILLGHDIGPLADELTDRGAHRVLLIDDPALATYTTEPYASALTAVIERCRPDIVLYGATAIGRDLAPRVSARVKTGLTADCTQLDIDPETGGLRMTRPAFGGNLMATIVCPAHRPQMATVRPGVMQPAECGPTPEASVEVVDPGLTRNARCVEVVEIIQRVLDRVDIMDAKILVAGGRGVGSRENFAQLEALAEVLGGTIAASRPCVEAGWAPKDRQVGQTGKTVRPKVYLAVGISGAIQHLAGMEDSELIIAINHDETAPIFSVADLGIVGDLNQIIPLLTAKLRAMKGEEGSCLL